MKDNISSKSYRRYLILVFALALLPRIALACINHDPFRTPLDELSTMSSAAYVAGLDWQNVISSCNYYYGAGFSILLAPLFYFISNPYVLYGVCICAAGALQSLIAPIAFHLMYHYFDIRDKRFLIVGALASSYCVVTRNTRFYNEHSMTLLFWVIIWILCILLKNIDDSRKKTKWTIILMLTMGYSMTIHSRSSIYFIAIFIVIIMHFIIYRKWIVSRIAAIVGACAGYAGAKLFINWIVKNVYLYEEGDKLKNVDVPLELSKELLKSPISWNGWLSTIVGQVHTSIIFTAGIAAIVIPVVVAFLYRAFLQAPFFEGKIKPESRKQLVDMEKPYLALVGFMCVLCIGGTIFAQSLTWLPSVHDALADNTYYKNSYAYKAFTYFRYYGCYIGPFLLVGLTLLHQAEDLMKKYGGIILTFFVSIQLLFCCFVLPHIVNCGVAEMVYWPFNLQKTDPAHTRYYAVGLMAATIGFVIYFVCYVRKRKIIPLVLLMVLLVYEYCYCSVFQDGFYMKQFDSKADATYTLITELEDGNEEIPHTLYVYDRERKTQKRVYVVQFLLKDYEIVPTLPDEDVADAIVFSKMSGREELIEMGYSYAVLDDNEYVYVKGNTYKNMLERYGYTFSNTVSQAE